MNPKNPKRWQHLQEKTRNASDSPGVYRMLTSDHKILYIGKAKNLQNRTRTYFPTSIEQIEDLKTRILVSKAFDIDFILTNSEAEALILESILIRKHKPKYNILLKDDRSYPYVMIDENHSYPRLVYLRRPKKGPKMKIYGPFASASSLRSALRTINRCFKLRDCTDLEFSNRSRPCINYQIEICSAPCTNMISADDYQKSIHRALNVLGGQTRDVSAQLTEEMNVLSEKQEYEEAAKVRDQISLLVQASEKKKRGDTIEQSATKPTHQDIIGFYRKPESATVAVIFVREGDIVDTAYFHLDHLENQSDQEVLAQFLAQFYLDQDPLQEETRSAMTTASFPGTELRRNPGEIFVPFEIPEKSLLEESFTALGIPMKVRTDSTKKTKELLEMAQRNAANSFDERQREKGSIYRVLAELKAKLRLENYPRRIECFDISNLGDTGIVASRVTFIEGKADKSLYRHYKIRTSDRQNDFAAMREVIERRLQRSTKQEDGSEPEELPDLLIVDGGKGQLSMAMEVVKQLNITGVDIVSLAKAKGSLDPESQDPELKNFERVFKPGRLNPVVLAPDSPVCHLMQRIRDEAHRFAIEFQRKQRY